MSDKIRFVVATRKTESEFHDETLLGKCLKLYPGLYELDIYASNEQGLPALYNKSIRRSESNPAILVFVHDDIFLMNYWWSAQIREALNSFQIVGVAGNQRRLAGQPSWLHTDETLSEIDYKYMSGCVGSGNAFCLPETIQIYGPAPREVKLLDGVFIAAQSSTLHQSNLMFDERFSFHFYDLDFCRQAELLGLVLGTWPIPILHDSLGNVDESWLNSKIKYFENGVHKI